ncbi:KpsF/GutQ family sugar-phosphate isomerase [Erythrobacter sanguineus]|uniref:Arabinose-5-phosphate isomerase n=1 Tax=Erythrobacter sanguineus TaxID=198312 RepID=A0A1M7T2U1_9SPHN|nr:KpsF/GutQ family sugar-phosphate isomerase [Erythrobacter sanguineus]SHN65006.1 arabinose-5-phosphate isomerase [Erythrobacter sanguineus]
MVSPRLRPDRDTEVRPSHVEIGRSVITMEADALRELSDALGDTFRQAVEMILGCKQRVIVSGIGKSGHVARKVAATLAATGTPALFVHAAEAAHGDAGMVSPGDVLIVFSNSGATVEVQPLCIYAKAIGCPVIGISRNPNSLLSRTADLGLLLPKVEEACTSSLAPTTSTAMMLALGDALAVAAMRARGLSGSDVRALHPGGEIGLHLRSVEDVMHAGDRLPLVGLASPMPDVLVTMTEKRLGIAGVVNEQGELVGIITDGDLRRRARNVVFGTAADVMTDMPRTILRTARVQEAFELMNTHRITVLFVVDERQPRVPLGAVQIYDIAVPPAPEPTLGAPR